MAPAIWRQSGCSWATRRSSQRRDIYALLIKGPTRSQFLEPSISDAVGGYRISRPQRLSKRTFGGGTDGLLRPSRPGEFPPEPLTDPDLTLSRHTARATA